MPSVFAEAGSSCVSDASTKPFDSNQDVTADDTYWVPAGQAIRADLPLPDGSGYPAVLVEGGFYGWFSTDSRGDPVLTGYAADGTVIGEVTIPRLR